MVYIIDAKRTPIGSFLGNFQTISSPQLAASLIKYFKNKYEKALSHTDEVILGCVLSAGLKQAPARQAALLGELNPQISAVTLNKVCGSGMKAIMMGSDSILTGTNQIVIAGGMENMSLAPFLLPHARQGQRLGHVSFKDHMFLDGLEDAYEGKLMGLYAEKTAEKYHFSRQDQDNYTIRSINRAQEAIEKNYLQKEIISIDKKNRQLTEKIEIDEEPGRAKIDKISSLKPAFLPNGTVTAASSSSISDGAAALILSNKEKLDLFETSPIAEIKGYASFSTSPEWFTIAPVKAIEKLLQKINWNLQDVDLFEINEAFAVVTMAAIKELNLSIDKVNIFGGACALGHPIGASGARIVVTLINALKQKNKKRGVAAICIGGGEATAIAIEVLD